MRQNVLHSATSNYIGKKADRNANSFKAPMPQRSTARLPQKMLHEVVNVINYMTFHFCSTALHMRPMQHAALSGNSETAKKEKRKNKADEITNKISILFEHGDITRSNLC